MLSSSKDVGEDDRDRTESRSSAIQQSEESYQQEVQDNQVYVQQNYIGVRDYDNRPKKNGPGTINTYI